jgi:hypothetical protein
MEHVVFYPSAEGTPAFARVNSLAEATSFVEHLRNSMGTTDFSVHALTPVPLAFRAYYHVELPPGEEGTPAATVAVVAVDAAPDVADEAVVAAPTLVAVPEPVAVPVEDVAVAPLESAEPVAVSLVPAVPAEADEPTAASDDAGQAVEEDRSEEWVAEAAHIEPPALAPVADLADVVALAPPVATPFAQAPPVGVAPTAPVAEVAETDVEPPAADETATADVVPAGAPSGRRSMGFFAR